MIPKVIAVWKSVWPPLLAMLPTGVVVILDRIVDLFVWFGKLKEGAATFSYFAAGFMSIGMYFLARRKANKEDKQAKRKHHRDT